MKTFKITLHIYATSIPNRNLTEYFCLSKKRWWRNADFGFQSLSLR